MFNSSISVPDSVLSSISAVFLSCPPSLLLFLLHLSFPLLWLLISLETYSSFSRPKAFHLLKPYPPQVVAQFPCFSSHPNFQESYKLALSISPVSIQSSVHCNLASTHTIHQICACCGRYNLTARPSYQFIVSVSPDHS